MTALLPFSTDGAPADGARTPFEQVLGRRPELLAAYRDFYGSFWDRDVLPSRLVELVRLRIAQLHGCAAESAIRDEAAGVDDACLAALTTWPASEAFSEVERAALAYAELIPFAHHQITDAQVAEVKSHLGDRGFVALAILATFVDANCRLRPLFGLPPTPVPPGAKPASATGRLY